MNLSALSASVKAFGKPSGKPFGQSKSAGINKPSGKSTDRLRKREAQLQFLRQSTRLEESTAPHLVRATLVLLSVAVLAFIVWMCFAKVEEITSAPGEVYPQGFSRIVQHFDGGIVKEILVRDGSEVKAGQALLVLDGVGTKEDLSRATIEMQGLQRSAGTARQMFRIQQTLKAQGVSSEVRYLEAQSTLNQIENQLSQQQQIVQRLQARADRLVVHAPYSGVVKGLKLNTIGEVVTPGDPLMEIVPTQDTLVVEARIAPQDIGRVAVGEPVKLKVSSFDYGRYGTIPGRVVSISAATFQPAAGEAYYRARISLSQNHVGRNTKHKIQPGMTVIVGIITGKKTIMAYLLKPMQRAFESSLTEP
jgi:multidrug efflux pump subunit AcrA (membrane-fusion protein)